MRNATGIACVIAATALVGANFAIVSRAAASAV